MCKHNNKNLIVITNRTDVKASLVTAGPLYRGSKYIVWESVEWEYVVCVADGMADCLAYKWLLK